MEDKETQKVIIENLTTKFFKPILYALMESIENKQLVNSTEFKFICKAKIKEQPQHDFSVMFKNLDYNKIKEFAKK